MVVGDAVTAPAWRPIADLIRVDGVARWAWLIPPAEQRALTGAGLRSQRAADGTVRLMARVDEEGGGCLTAA